MARIITIQKNGVKIGTSGVRAKDNTPPEKTKLAGWSPSSIRRNNDFLRTVVHSELDHLQGFAFTGTVRDCPPTSDDWHKALLKLWRRLKRLGVVLIHWLIEWQRRGAPHLHCSLFFDNPPIDIQQKVLSHWLDLTGKWGADYSGQRITPIYDAAGWDQYMSKHCQRGLGHYQRSPENVPAEWQSKTGRMWGKWGPWPVQESVKLQVDDPAHDKARRIIRNWRIADARSSGNKKRIKSARKMLQCNELKLSSCRGLSEWLPESESLRLLHWLQSQGHDMMQI